MTAAEELSRSVGMSRACKVLGVVRATLYRRRRPKVRATITPKRKTQPPRALSSAERTRVLEVLHSERFVDKAPTETFATLLDENQYLCSIRTMYRLLEANDEVRERRNQRRHPSRAKPRLVARAPNQVWSWDITKLRGPEKWVLYYLYVVMDIFSRYVVGWMLAERESKALAKRLFEETCAKEGVAPGELTVHADRGSAMKSGTVHDLFASLGITPSHSRPRVSNDNPYSESQFKTLKYQPEFPDRFGGPSNARSFCGNFMHWYNVEHHHSGLALLTPAVVHHGHVREVVTERQRALDAAYAAHPERFVRGRPRVPQPPSEVWINRPGKEIELEKAQ